jgi:prepilin-type N-terminal cleavage/methylation domain-containing protein
MNNRDCGFTLIEIIVSLVLVGVIATVAGMGLVSAAKGYLFTKENAQMAQKANLAMLRISRELMELTDVSNATGTTIAYERVAGLRKLGLDNGQIKIALDATPLANGDVLIDGVNSFGLSYWSGTNPWTVAMGVAQLSAIQMNLVLTRSDSGVGNISFSTTIIPRNTRGYGGAPPVTNPPSRPGGCFVASAANGQADHPMVWILPVFTAAIATLMLHFPLGIPLIALTFGWVVVTVLFLGRRKGGPAMTHLKGHQGAVLIGLIVTMVVIAALGAAMLPLTSTSTLNQVMANRSARAYFLAESGYRYAAGQYMNAGSENAKDAALETMNTQGTFTLCINNDGQFELEIYPYYFITTSDPNGGTSLNTKVPGGFPPDLTLTSGRLKIASAYYNYTSASHTGQNVTFIMTQIMPSMPVGTTAYSVAKTSNAVQTVSKGGSLNLQAGTGSAFPSINGTFRVNNQVYSYKARSGNQLTGIDDPDDPNMPPFTVNPNTDITLEKFIKLHSKGTYGQGSTATSREIIYHVPMGFVARAAGPGKTGWHDTFDDKSHWFEEGDGTSTVGSHGIASVDGGNALKVTGAENIGASNRASLISLNWATTDANLASSWDSGGNLLSYDAQVKIKVDDEPYFMAGISFRLDEDGNSYGISFLRAEAHHSDGIPGDLVPITDQPMVVLWQQTNGGSDWVWLAYKTLETNDYILSNEFFFDDMESGTSKWTAESPWAQITSDYHSETTCWTDSPGGDYQNNVDTKLTSETIDLSGSTSPVLNFWHHYRIRSTGPSGEDFGDVEISTNGGGSWTRIQRYEGNQNSWENVKLDLSAYAGQANVKIRFRLITDGSGTRDGWYIDDVSVSEERVDWPTLMVRLEERVPSSGRFAGQKVNDIRVFIGDTGAHGTANDDPLDNNRLANPRDQVNWPPDGVDETAADNDYFTLVQWNANLDGSVDRLGSGKELNAIIRSNSLTTPSSGSFTLAELGLHTWGWSSTDVSFDDFAVQLEGSAGGSTGFLIPIQE